MPIVYEWPDAQEASEVKSRPPPIHVPGFYDVEGVAEALALRLVNCLLLMIIP